MPEQSGFLARTGLDSIRIGGHKVPIALIGGVAAVTGVVLVLRARRQGTPVASVGAQPPYTAASNGFGTQGFSPDYSGALANITQQLTGLTQQGANLVPPAAPPPPPVMGSLRSLPGQPSDLFIPLALQPGGKVVGWAPPGSAVTLAGAPVPATWAGTALLAEPVKYLGGDFFINSLNLA